MYLPAVFSKWFHQHFCSGRSGFAEIKTIKKKQVFYGPSGNLYDQI